MANQPSSYLKRIVVAVGVACSLAVVGLAAVDQIRLWGRLNACRSEDPDVRIKALSALAKERDARAAELVGEILQTEQDRAVLRAAGYAATRFRDKRNLPLLLARAEQGPDDPTRAWLLMYAGRLAAGNQNTTDRLRAWLNAEGEPWRQVGSAAGLLLMGCPEGGTALIAIAKDENHPGRVMAFQELRHIGRLMTETVGWPITWPETLADTDTSFWKSLSRFWRERGSRQLLNDVLAYRFGHDPKLYELRRLLHARDKVARWFE